MSKSSIHEEPTTGGPALEQLLERLGAVRFTRVADSSLRFVEIEGPCAERMGIQKATLVGDAYSFWARVDSRDRRRVLAALEDAVRKGSTYRVLYRLESSDGIVRRVREEGAAVLGEDGETEQLEGVILDAAGEPPVRSEDGLAEELAESEERFRRLAQHSGAMVIEVSEGPRISFASERLCEELGLRAELLEGRDPLSLVHPDDQGHVLQTAREAIRTGDEAELLCRLERSDGSWVWAELGGRAYASSTGHRRGVVSGRSVENRVQIEEAFLAQRMAESRIGQLSRRFLELGSGGLDDAITEAVEAAAEIGGADRCYLAAFSADRYGEARTWLWKRDPADTWQLDLSPRNARANLWMGEQLRRGEMVRIPSVASLPESQRATRDRMLAIGAASSCVIPVRFDGQLTALLGFQTVGEERDWSQQEIALLRLVAELLSTVLQRSDIEGALRDGEQRLQVLADSAQDGICENALADGEILYANPRYFEMHGYSVEEAQGMSSFDFMHPQDLADIRLAHEAFERGDLGQSFQGTLLYRGLHRNGHIVWLEANGRLYRTAAGEGRSAAVIRDVTERERARQVMSRRLENQRRIANVARDLLALGFEEMDAGIDEGLVSLLPISNADRAWLISVDGATGNKEAWEWRADGVAAPGGRLQDLALTDYPMAHALFHQGKELHIDGTSDLPADAPERRFMEARGATALLAIPLHSGSEIAGAVGFERSEGGAVWDEEAIALLRLGGEVFVSAISRKRAEEALRESRGQLLQAQKMEAVGTLAGGVAHDFNNQLSVILGNARFVHGEVEDPDLREAMTDLERAADYCAQLTRQLLSFSRHAPAEPGATSVPRVLRDVAELTAPLLSTGIGFEAVAHDEFATVWADHTQLQQVLVNLVVNARDAMPDGGNLSIRTEARTVFESEAQRLGLPHAGDYVLFVVSDTGFGMDAATLARIFEPFFTTKAPGKGTGLGLATVYGILKESGGAISADSAPGVGTTFRLLLPAAGEDAETGSSAPTAGLRGGETLLLVEDEQSVRRLLRRMLERIGFLVLAAESAEEAIELSASHAGEIDVLVSDVSMPGMGGVELGRRLVADRPRLRVLLVTGNATDDVSLPGARILAKPFRQEELEWALEGLLRAESTSR